MLIISDDIRRCRFKSTFNNLIIIGIIFYHFYSYLRVYQSYKCKNFLHNFRYLFIREIKISL